MAVSDYSTTAGSNTSISGINIAEGCSPANLNNAIRQLMADVKAFYNAAQPLDTDLTSWAGVTRASGFDTFVATPSSANLRALLTDETGTGALAFSGGAIDLTNATGLTTSGIAAGSLTTAAETIAANNSDTQVPTSAAVFGALPRVLLASKTASASATLNFTEFNNTLYRYYEFEFEHVKPATNSVQLRAALSTNGGSTWDTAAGSYSNTGFVTNGATLAHFGAGSVAYMELSNVTDVGNGASSFGVDGMVKLYLAPDATTQTRMIFNGAYDNAGGTSIYVSSNSRRLAAQDTDGIQFFFQTGNIASGTIRMYGVR